MTRIRFKGSPRSQALLAQACGISAPHRSTPRNRSNVGSWAGVSTRLCGNCTAVVPRTQRSAQRCAAEPGPKAAALRVPVLRSSAWRCTASGTRSAIGRLSASRRRLRPALATIFGGAPLASTGAAAPGPFEPLALCSVVIAARIITHGSAVIAVGGAIGAGEIFDAPGEIGVGIAQARGVAGVAEAACGRRA